MNLAWERPRNMAESMKALSQNNFWQGNYGCPSQVQGTWLAEAYEMLNWIHELMRENA